jgi:hypothetical protein
MARKNREIIYLLRGLLLDKVARSMSLKRMIFYENLQKDRTKEDITFYGIF